jgi:hypothetical protein
MKTVKANEIHIFSLLEFLHDEVMSSGGDGDALWYTRFYDIRDIERIVRDYNDEHSIGWDVDTVDDNTINWGIDQEWVTITNDLKTFNESPDWIQIKIRY